MQCRPQALIVSNSDRGGQWFAVGRCIVIVQLLTHGLLGVRSKLCPQICRLIRVLLSGLNFADCGQLYARIGMPHGRLRALSVLIRRLSELLVSRLQCAGLDVLRLKAWIGD